MKLIRGLIFFGVIVMCFFAKAQDYVTVKSMQNLDSSVPFAQGFLHGGTQFLDSAKVAKLKPAFWRIGAYWLAGSDYNSTKKFNSKITVNVNDLYMIANGIVSQTQSQPWSDNWQSWDSLLTLFTTNSVADNQPIDYWDLWGEPDNFWTGTYANWIEMYRRSDSILSGIVPNSKIIGPEFGFGSCNFDAQAIVDFLDNLWDEGAKVNGVSWHEFCQPEDVVTHVQQIRDSLAVRPWLGNLEILIPEYAGPSNHQIPGWNVGWLYYLEQAKVNWVSHGCWQETDGVQSWSNCEFGLNGLFMSDNSTPQPNYWVHRAYADLDSNRVVCLSSEAKTVGLARKNDETEEMKVLVGRYDNPNLGMHNSPSSVSVKIESYPYCSNCTKPFVIQRIPSNDVPYSIPLSAPLTIFSGNITFVNDSATVTLPNFVDGDAYFLYINPNEGSVLSLENRGNTFTEIKISPNPADDLLHIETLGNETIHFSVYNMLGLLQMEFSTDSTSTIDVSHLPSGFYYIQSSNMSKNNLKFLKK